MICHPGPGVFTSPEFVSNATARNPKVVFGAEGVYDFTPTISNAWEQTKTETGAISISGNECGVDTVVGMAIALNGNADPADMCPFRLWVLPPTT